ncbi:MAG: phosphoribosylformylglycinamidine synthase subunit PurQ [Alphaproteobacteria bacterium]|nr:phosphoribosylformylglycinamidine synthase subunit PurQ [Alphaproteobacteria bacterium]
MKAAIVVFPASNCDRDIQVALRQSMGVEPIMVWHRDSELPAVDLIVLPGGFSYGDYLRAGAMAAHSPIMREVVARAEAGVPTLGVCNGFQILTEAGLLPGVLMRNARLRFVCRDVYLRVEATNTIFTGGYRHRQVVRIPIAHADGNYYADERTIAEIEDDGRVAFRYCEPDGNATSAANPNGAMHNIAGIFNAKRTVLGMMPHPERLADPALGGTDGRALFEHLFAALP